MEYGVQNDSLCVVEGLGDVTRHTYSRGQLFAIRRKMKLIDTPIIMYDLKELGILRYRGRRGGRYSKDKLFSRANLVPVATDEAIRRLNRKGEVHIDDLHTLGILRYRGRESRTTSSINAYAFCTTE